MPPVPIPRPPGRSPHPVRRRRRCDDPDRALTGRAIPRAAGAVSIFIDRPGEPTMFHVRGSRRKEPAIRIGVESLEDRAVPTAGVAAVEIPYLRVITHLNTL